MDVKQKLHVGYYNGFLKIVTDDKCDGVSSDGLSKIPCIYFLNDF